MPHKKGTFKRLELDASLKYFFSNLTQKIVFPNLCRPCGIGQF
jgi:hypothetical protein